MKFSHRKAFTLIELLIVIVVIGILSSVMMLSSTEAMSSAEATTIAANLRALKTAVIAFYTDNMYALKSNAKEYNKQNFFNNNEYLQPAKLAPYLNGKDEDLNLKGNDNNYNEGYAVVYKSSTSEWIARYRIERGSNNSPVRPKLKSRAASLGLRKNDNTSQYNGEETVALHIFTAKIPF